MIEKVKFENFKSLRVFNLEHLERLNVFVGANASGKTSILQGIYCLAESARLGPASIFRREFAPEILVNRNAKPGSFFLGCYTDIGFATLLLAQDSEAPYATQLRDTNWSFNWTVEAASQGDSGTTQTQIEEVKQSIGRASLVAFRASALSSPSYMENPSPILNASGSNLASVLEVLSQEDEHCFERITEYMQRMVPHFMKVRFRKTPVLKNETELVRFGDDGVRRTSRRKYTGTRFLIDFTHAKGVEASACSEGTLLALAYLTLALGPASPELLLIDDLEHGFHPTAQQGLVAIFREILEIHPELQIFATCHSPYLLDCLKVNEVRLVALGNDGATECAMLSENKKFDKWKEEMAPGEMWSLFGENWITERNGQ